ncbi:MAG: RagB/SusD family nutrient uptake outer membrane protein [Prevotellaceae bacterium]|jgi:hypothetical protein|nr:RagB/SusD family nutrient uptake outer membrane protein [Prevotellaceae bacterium]
MMKKYIAYIGVLMALLSFSCTKVLDKEPYDSIPEQNVWSSLEQSNLYLNNLYNLTSPAFPTATGNVPFYSLRLSALSDETGGHSDLAKFLNGQLTIESVGDFGNDTYSKIRKINMLLERIESGGITDQEGINRIKGQAYFLRAWTYWNLVNLYGGVPMITSTQSMSASGEVTKEILPERTRTSECIDTIVRDLDLAAQYLPPRWDANNYGRITRGAAMALKGRVLLFWASPQFVSEYGGSKTDRWQRAYKANKNALDTLTVDGYGLHPRFDELFINCMEQTREAIFVRVYDASIAGSYNHSYDNGARPSDQGTGGGGGTNNPTWQLVKAFPMENGYPTYHPDTSESHYNERMYWQRRDPRFYHTIAYNSGTWSLSGNTGYKVWTYYNRSGISYISTEGRNASSTGFYCKKWVNPNIAATDVGKVGTDWIEIRYAEVLLNFAECANEIDQKGEAIAAIKDIRDRVSLPLGPIEFMANTDTLREAIIRERQVELAFENKRHWDLRRRNMFKYDLGVNTPSLNGTWRAGVRLIRSGTEDENIFVGKRNTVYNFEAANIYNTFFEKASDEFITEGTLVSLDTLDTQYLINFEQPKYNFYGIPQTNLDKNKNLKQNIYWGGDFNPYE